MKKTLSFDYQKEKLKEREILLPVDNLEIYLEILFDMIYRYKPNLKLLGKNNKISVNSYDYEGLSI